MFVLISPKTNKYIESWVHCSYTQILTLPMNFLSSSNQKLEFWTPRNMQGVKIVSFFVFCHFDRGISQFSRVSQRGFSNYFKVKQWKINSATKNIWLMAGMWNLIFAFLSFLMGATSNVESSNIILASKKNCKKLFLKAKYSLLFPPAKSFHAMFFWFTSKIRCWTRETLRL